MQDTHNVNNSTVLSIATIYRNRLNDKLNITVESINLCGNLPTKNYWIVNKAGKNSSIGTNFLSIAFINKYYLSIPLMIYIYIVI